MLPFWENRGGEAPVQLESLGGRARRLYCSYIAGSLPPLGSSSSSFFGATVVETAAAVVVAAAAATFFPSAMQSLAYLSKEKRQ